MSTMFYWMTSVLTLVAKGCGLTDQVLAGQFIRRQLQNVFKVFKQNFNVFLSFHPSTGALFFAGEGRNDHLL